VRIDEEDTAFAIEERRETKLTMEEMDSFYRGKLLTLNAHSSDEQVKRIFDDVDEKYDKVTGEAGYVAFKTCTPLFHQLLQEINNDRTSDLRILDVGAGTGLVGNVLRDHGYSNIDALDISQKMLDEAKKLNIYKNMFCVALGEKPIPGIENDQYDAAICVGTLTVGHVKPVALDEIVRIVKPGGIIGFTLREDVFNEIYDHENFEESRTKFGYREKITKMENEKKWKLIRRDLVENHTSVDEMRAKCYSFMYQVL